VLRRAARTMEHLSSRGLHLAARAIRLV